MTGRGWGKSRTGAEAVREWVEHGIRRIALVGATPADVRDVMIYGDPMRQSGLQQVFPPHQKPIYKPSLRKVMFHTGAEAHVYSAHKHPDESGLRGPQHEKAWGDEPQKWKYPQNLDQLMFGLRIGSKPQVLLTGTPRPIPLIKTLVDRAKKHDRVVMSVGTTYDNRANLAPEFLHEVVKSYEGTRLGRQEILGELIDEIAGALWKLEWIERDRVMTAPMVERLVVAVDPSGNLGEEDRAETGIIVAGCSADRQGYVVDDCTVRGTPAQWATQVVNAYHEHKADSIVAERNHGGEMVRHTIHSVDDRVPVRLVTATRGKAVRAEPISLLAEQGRLHHVGAFAELESQLTTWVPGEKSPDRLDAYVWAFTDLMLDGGRTELMVGSDQDDVHTTTHGTQQVDEVIASRLASAGVHFPED